MKLHFTSDWLKQKISHDKDIECECGIILLGPHNCEYSFPDIPVE